MHVLFLAEGDPENPATSGSGTPASVIQHLRRLGATVTSTDVDLHGAARGVGAGLAFSRDRNRWRARYHLGRPALALRSRNASRAVRSMGGQCDVVLQYGGTFAPDPRLGVPCFLYCDNNVYNTYRQPLSWGAALPTHELRAVLAWERRVYTGAAAVFTFSDYVRRSFLEGYDLAPERVITVGSGPNLDRAAVPPRQRDSAGAPTILFVGRDWAGKGGPLLLDAFARVRHSLPDARLLVVGPPTFPGELPAGVTFLGRLRKDDPDEFRQLVAAYAEADVFCLPTRYESFGIAIVEAMFFGLPVVATDDWAIRETVADGTTGFRVAVDDVDGYADRLLQLLRDRGLATRMGDAGRVRAETTFTWERVTGRMLDVMRTALDRPAATPPAIERLAHDHVRS